jgi:hypothetical protein
MRLLVVYFLSLSSFSTGFVALLHGKEQQRYQTQIQMRLAADDSTTLLSRRQLLNVAALATFPTIFSPSVAFSGSSLEDLPPDATRSYAQYRIPLQISADYYVFELQDKIADVEEWGDIGQLFRANNNRGQGQPSRIERDYVNPMRIVGLSMPPEFADDLRESQFKFEKAMGMITKATSGIRRDLPVEIDKEAVQVAKAGWEEGRQALNEFFVTLNEATGTNEMRSIPPAGPNQVKEYGRSQRRYFDLMKKTKLCQNRGGPTLSQAWGQLMVS